MKNLYLFIKRNYKQVSFGGSLTFLSGFGQTFLISLYVPAIVEAFNISEGTFGSIYAIATVTSSVILLSLGHAIDHKPVKRVTLLTLLGLAASAFLLGNSHYHILLLGLALVGLRLTGQGLLSHISQTVMARYYALDRGKALSVSSLGFSIGEAFFPIIISSFILWYGYETTANLSGLFLIVACIVMSFLKLNHFDNDLEATPRIAFRDLLREFKEIIGDKKFMIIMPASFFLSFTNTAVFFYQYVFVAQKGWSVSLYAAFFTAYAVTRFFMSIAGGIWIDKYSARLLFRVYLIPLCLGLLPFAFMSSIVGALIFLILSGITAGIAGTVKSAVLAEVYGTEKLGTIRSLFTMFMVLSTAIGPLLIGLLMDVNVPFVWLMLILFVLVLLSILNAQRIKNIRESA